MVYDFEDDEEYVRAYHALTTRQAFSLVRVEKLKAYLQLVDQPTKGNHKALIDRLAMHMTNPVEVRALYERLDDLAKLQIQEATHHAGQGWENVFEDKYGGWPRREDSDGSWYHFKPTLLDLFFPDDMSLPTDLRALLLQFVPKPPPVTLDAYDELPLEGYQTVEQQQNLSRKEHGTTLHVRATARGALKAIKGILRLIQAGEVRVNAKTRQPTPGALTAIGKVLLDGDFYRPEDQSKEKGDPGASDLGIQVYAWPFLVQAAGLATAAGTHLQLTAKGQKALLAPAQELIQTVWTKWQPSALLDEFSRISGIKGQQSKGRFLTALVPRRKAVVDVLRQCPVHKWIRIDDLFRFLKITAQEFKVANQERKLRVSTDYTRQGFIGIKKWENLEGRYVLVLLFEYLATLGLVDVAYIHPTGARADFEETYWSDDLVSLSRYDGLRSVRINALGAWCLGLAADYEPEVVSVPRDLLVLPNHDVVVNVQPIDPEVVLVLDRYAVRKSGPVWALEQGKILSAVEEGLTIRELQDFLTSRSQTPLP